jgi:Periplasmic protein involved in polysaccharide export
MERRRTPQARYVVMAVLTLTAWAAVGWTQQQQPAPAQKEPDEKESFEELAQQAAAPVDPKSYKIGPEDILMIRVWRENELSGPVAVRPDGLITLPLIGDVQAGGLTPEELKDALTQKLSTLINEPRVMVSVQAVRSKKYYITGEVMRSGAYPLVSPITVLEALSNAGGFREFANLKKIVIIRGNERLKFNYKEVIAGKNLEQNIQIQNGDHIVVP